MEVTALTVAQQFLGLREGKGTIDNAMVVGMLQLDSGWVAHDDVPWCSAFVNFVCFCLGLPRSRSLAARSWLIVGRAVPEEHAQPGFDVVVLKRGAGVQPGPDVLQAPGHVGFFAGLDATTVSLLGGNQGDTVSLAHFPRTDILSIRRLVS